MCSNIIPDNSSGDFGEKIIKLKYNIKWYWLRRFNFKSIVDIFWYRDLKIKQWGLELNIKIFGI
jgi:hypothetical protein